MPRLEGREPTRKTIDFERLESVASFVYTWDKWVFKKPCQVTGCGHIVSGTWDKEKHGWDVCGDTAGCAVMYDDTPEEKLRGTGKSPPSWLVCACCLGRFDEGWRQAHADADSE